MWHLFGDDRLSASARAFIDRAAQTNLKVVLSTISLAEIIYLTEKNRVSASAYKKLRQALNLADYVIEEAPVTVGIVDAMGQISRAEVPDMPDRIIAATGVYFRVPDISRDGRIATSNVETVW